jgi:hypothetical protein
MEIPNPPTPGLSHADIAAQAYLLWQQDGCLPGRDLEHWLRAETLLNRKLNSPVPTPLAANPQPAIPAPRKSRKPAAARRPANRLPSE